MRGWLAVTLLAVVVAAAALRIYRLGDLPPGLYCDEAALGFNAHLIAHGGVDEHGDVLPLYFWSFDLAYKNPVFIYAAAIPVRLLGLDEFSVRFTSALFGIGTVIGIFYLGRVLYSPWVGLWAALWLAVCPWHLHFSRIAFELISFPFLFVIGVTSLGGFVRGRRSLGRAALFLGLCVYAYAIAILFVPPFLLGFVVLFVPELRHRWREALVAWVILVLTVAPAAVFQARAAERATQYFGMNTILQPDVPLVDAARAFAKNYTQFFSPSFLLTDGDPIPRHAVAGFGELLPIALAFAAFGIAAALWRRDRVSALVLWWLVVYPVAPSLMIESPSASRGIVGASVFCLLAGLGVHTSLRALRRVTRWRPAQWALQAAVVAAILYALQGEARRYLNAYFFDYPTYAAAGYRGFQYGYRDVIRYMESHRDAYDRLLLTITGANQPLIFPLFYRAPDPHTWLTTHDSGYSLFDPAIFDPADPDSGRVLAALDPSDLVSYRDYTIKKTIVAPGGQTVFVIAELRTRQAP
jgi:4-amino-4-deoxy-L-arabinose transferase-like glycosyltransferase